MTTPLSLSVSSTNKRSDKEDKAMEKEKQEEEASRREYQPPYISRMQPLTKEAYGGGMYGKDDEGPERKVDKAPARDTQSADEPKEATIQPKHKPPPSSGNRDIDSTGQSYIQ
ncbi:hypothetical protein K7X08_003215 [Anisodus acutangulus]|uniref:Uncharacterized protein n=1 Tax=Anisodus acutangulus TaxID=402998 RepID=A0A9Q1MDR8_9SOLA|nr:hypothetical protein K7X08_003215 [Anisodus acutangulus]